LIDALQPFVREHQGFNGYVIAFGLQVADLILTRPSVPQNPAHHRLPLRIQQSDIYWRALNFAFEDGLEPLPESRVSGDTALQCHVRGLVETGKLAHRVQFVAALTVFNRCHLHCESAYLGEVRFGNVLDLNQKIESREWVITSSHVSPRDSVRK